MPFLSDQWLAELSGSAAALEHQLSRFPELSQAVVPVDFELLVDEDSYLAPVDDHLQGELRGRLIQPGGRESDLPPVAGAIGIEFDTFEGYLEIETLDTPARAQRRGLGRLIMAGIADLAERLGIETLTLEAGKTGRYAWARCGFRFFDPDQDRDRVLGAAQDFARALGRSPDLSQIAEPWQLAAVPGRVTVAEIQAAGGPVIDAESGEEEWSLGRALLLGPPESANTWFGVLETSQQSADRVRLDAYARAIDT
jgi:GNAT superfamily N-acetyltransferase